MRFERKTWDEFVKFTNGRAKNIRIPRCIGCKATCELETISGVFTIEEGDFITKFRNELLVIDEGEMELFEEIRNLGMEMMFHGFEVPFFISGEKINLPYTVDRVELTPDNNWEYYFKDNDDEYVMTINKV